MKKIHFRIGALFIIIMIMFLNLSCKNVDVKQLSSEYIREWKQFYPSRALAAGDKTSAFSFENLSNRSINQWVNFNKKILEKIGRFPDKLSLDDRIDVKILKRQILTEIERWEIDQAQNNSSSVYASLISQAMTHILVRDKLSPEEKISAIYKRLSGINSLCSQAIKNLKNGRPFSTKRSIGILESTASFYSKNLYKITSTWVKPEKQEKLRMACLDTGKKILYLASHINTKVVPAITKSDYYGKKEYSKKLKIYTHNSLSPEELIKIAYKEILTVRGLMADVSKKYWEKTYPDRKLPAEFDELLKITMEDMESDRETNQKDFLKLFVDLTDRSENFVKNMKIATVPEKRTLKIQMSPEHFAGAAVGGVYSTGPFDPYEDTLFFLPSIPDKAPENLKEGFYRSFNNHFNTMIITHEMFPGHYLQLKIAAKNPRMVRSLFADQIYAEGWATLCEVITLDMGWNNNNRLTRLAHLRKRLENAVRAFVSVQVHCNQWTRKKMTKFAVETGLLAPQFAINLWRRVINSPLQLTSYFVGFKKFSEILDFEKKRLGKNFRIREFSDSIINAGAVPVDELTEILKRDIPE